MVVAWKHALLANVIASLSVQPEGRQDFVATEYLHRAARYSLPHQLVRLLFEDCAVRARPKRHNVALVADVFRHEWQRVDVMACRRRCDQPDRETPQYDSNAASVATQG